MPGNGRGRSVRPHPKPGSAPTPDAARRPKSPLAPQNHNSKFLTPKAPPSTLCALAVRRRMQRIASITYLRPAKPTQRLHLAPEQGRAGDDHLHFEAPWPRHYRRNQTFEMVPADGVRPIMAAGAAIAPFKASSSSSSFRGTKWHGTACCRHLVRIRAIPGES